MRTLAMESSPVDYKKITDSIEDALKKINTYQGKEIYLFLGNTGAGKSTAICYLTGNKLSKMRFQDRVILERAYEDSTPPIPCPFFGHMFHAETYFADIWKKNEDLQFIYADTPGLNEPNPDRRLSISINIEVAVRKVKQIKGIIVTVAREDINSEKGKLIRELIKSMVSFINLDNFSMEKLPPILFLINKLDNNIFSSDKTEMEEKMSIISSIKLITKDNTRALLGKRNYHPFSFLDTNTDNLVLLNPSDNGESRIKIETILKRFNEWNLDLKGNFNFNMDNDDYAMTPERTAFEIFIKEKAKEGIELIKEIQKNAFNYYLHRKTLDIYKNYIQNQTKELKKYMKTRLQDYKNNRNRIENSCGSLEKIHEPVGHVLNLLSKFIGNFDSGKDFNYTTISMIGEISENITDRISTIIDSINMEIENKNSLISELKSSVKLEKFRDPHFVFSKDDWVNFESRTFSPKTYDGLSCRIESILINDYRHREVEFRETLSNYNPKTVSLLYSLGVGFSLTLALLLASYKLDLHKQLKFPQIAMAGGLISFIVWLMVSRPYAIYFNSGFYNIAFNPKEGRFIAECLKKRDNQIMKIDFSIPQKCNPNTILRIKGLIGEVKSLSQCNENIYIGALLSREIEIRVDKFLSDYHHGQKQEYILGNGTQQLNEKLNRYKDKELDFHISNILKIKCSTEYMDYCTGIYADLSNLYLPLSTTPVDSISAVTFISPSGILEAENKAYEEFNKWQLLNEQDPLNEIIVPYRKFEDPGSSDTNLVTSGAGRVVPGLPEQLMLAMTALFFLRKTGFFEFSYRSMQSGWQFFSTISLNISSMTSALKNFRSSGKKSSFCGRWSFFNIFNVHKSVAATQNNPGLTK